MGQHECATVRVQDSIQIQTGKQTIAIGVAKIQTLFLRVSTSVPVASASASNSACSESLNFVCLCTDTVNNKYPNMLSSVVILK